MNEMLRSNWVQICTELRIEIGFRAVAGCFLHVYNGNGGASINVCADFIIATFNGS